MPSLEYYQQTDTPPTDKVQLPKDVFLDMPSRDLLLRLLKVEPQQRLRSLRILPTIAFYKGYNFEEVKDKTLKANVFLIKHFGEDYRKPKVECVPTFEGFDETFISPDDE